jgi:hypothetical protein
MSEPSVLMTAWIEPGHLTRRRGRPAATVRLKECAAAAGRASAPVDH